MTGLDDSTLVAYVDDELDAEQARAVETALAGDPEARSRVVVFRETAALVRAAFDDPAREPVSPRLIRAVRKPQDVVPSEHHWRDEAAEYFRLYARDDRHLIELPGSRIEAIEAKLSHFLGKTLKVPDLTSHGLPFRGARLFAIDGDLMAAEGAQPAALLVYGLPNGKPLALCITPFTSKADEYPVSGRSGDMNLLSWFQSGQGYVFMGWVEPEFLRKVGMELVSQRDTG